jgi:hypothetical protein
MNDRRFQVEYYELGMTKAFISLRKARDEALRSGYKFNIYEKTAGLWKVLESR